MIYGRANELQYLNNVYARPGNQLLVVYGQKNVGKKTLIREFIKDKESFYYHAVPASPRQQLYLLGSCLREGNPDVNEYPTYEEVLQKLGERMTSDNKCVFVFEEWEQLIKNDSSFMEAIIGLLHRHYCKADVLVILSTSSIEFVENTMVSKIGRSAYEISGFLKIKELKFADLICRFPSFAMEDSVRLYSIMGGFPGLWNYFREDISIKENICCNILMKGCYLQQEGQRLIAEELRETSVYCTILAALAEGRQKLNELYLHTGFSRAKISVYLKNLMGLDVVEKIFSVDTPGHSHMKKGIYRISNAYVRFWFKFIYPNYGACMTMAPEDFYERYIAPDFDDYCEEYFSMVCREYMMLSAGRGALPFKPVKSGLYEGKSGKIDYVGQSEDGRVIVAFSDFSKNPISFEEYQTKRITIEKAGLSPEMVYFFGRVGFEERLRLEAESRGNIILIGMDEL